MYIVFEMQTNGDGAVGTLVNAYEDIREAESQYYTILAAAAVSAPQSSASKNAGNSFTPKYRKRQRVNSALTKKLKRISEK